MIEQHLHDLRHAASAMEIHRDKPARRLKVAQHRRAPADSLEIVDIPLAPRPRWRWRGRCSTALVEPPVAMTIATAFESRFSRDDVARFQILLDRAHQHLGGAIHRTDFLGVRRAISGESSRLMPSASKAVAIVFAVYCAPHAPNLGHACCSMPSKSSRDILPALKAPTASNAETTVRSCPFQRPGLIVPE